MIFSKKKKGIAFIVAVVIVLALIICGTIVIPFINDRSLQYDKEAYMKGSGTLANIFKPLPLIDISSVANTLDLIDKINFAIREVNEVLKTDFPELDRNSQALLNDVQELVPLVDPYNQLIKSAKDFDESNPETAKQLIMNLYVLAFGVIVVQGKIAYSIAFKTTGILNNILKLGKLRSLFGNTVYSEFLSKIHWYFRDYITNLPTELVDTINNLLRQIGYFG